MAVTTNAEYQRLLRYHNDDWHIEWFDSARPIKERIQWLHKTFGFMDGLLRPIEYHDIGRWGSGEIKGPTGNQIPKRYWIAIQTEQDYLLYKLKFSD